MLLREKPDLPESEPNLTRELSFTVVTARRRLDPQGHFERPRFESQNLADPDSEWVLPHEHKRPDIQWIHDDESAADDRHREKAFVIECKRLGANTPSRWRLNEQYVVGGIARYRSEEWRYGCHMHEGMMIAFVQNMELADILEEVNSHAQCHRFPLLLPEISEPASCAITRLGHVFDRNFPISPYRLTHLWLDIRDIAQRKEGSRTS